MHHVCRVLTLLAVLCAALIADGWPTVALAGTRRKPRPVNDHDVIIYFDNDVHGEVGGYAMVSALRQKSLQHVTPYVDVVSCGDFIQGSHLCAFSHGRDIITLLNMAGYSVATMGNHEFDYGPEHVERLQHLFRGDMVLCNFEDLRSHRIVYKPYVLRRYGNITVGYVGVLNPSTEISDSPQSYFDEEGNKIYSFHLFDVYNLVQEAIDQAHRDGADYVIILSHLGENVGLHINSLDLISNTHGAVAVLDGHAHHFDPGRWLPNAEGDSTLFVTTGSKFQNIGQLTIDTYGRLHTQMLDTRQLTERDPQIVATIDSLERMLSTTPPIGYSDFDLLGFDSFGIYERNCESNLGDLCADAIRHTMGADVGWANAGGIRVSIRQGAFGIREVINMYPFENSICISRVSGRMLLDALEYCLMWYPEDTGNFPQISGMRVTFDPAVPSAAVTDEHGSLLHVDADRPRRVTQVTMLNAEGQYEPIDPDRLYTVAGPSFILKNGGCGGIFAQAELLFDSGTLDTQSFEDFVSYTLGGRIPTTYRMPQGRITISPGGPPAP